MELLLEVSINVIMAKIPPKRLLPMAMMYHGWSFGLMSLPLLAWVVPNWRHLHFGIAIAIFLTIPLYFIMPESLFWLSSNGFHKVFFSKSICEIYVIKIICPVMNQASFTQYSYCL